MCTGSQARRLREAPALIPATSDHITVIAETFRLLGDPTRLRVLLACLEGPIAVGDIAKAVDASQSLVSHHLRLLRAARLVRGTRKMRQIFYEAADDHIRHMLIGMIEHVREDEA